MKTWQRKTHGENSTEIGGSATFSLTTHPYHFFSDIQSFLNVWGKTLDKLTGEKILCVWGAWDIEDGTWFDDAPMLVELTAGTLSVHV